MEKETRQAYIKRLWNANTADEIAAILDEYDLEQLPKKPEPNWDEAPDWAQWWAVDEDGSSYWYEEEPRLLRTCWGCTDGRVKGHEHEFDLNDYDWRGNLTKRP